MFKELTGGTIRHFLTAAGPLIVAYSPATASEWDTFIGSIVTLVGLGWSWKRKIENKPREG